MLPQVSPSDFERRCGRERYRKWRVSIHVAPEYKGGPGAGLALKDFFELMELEQPTSHKARGSRAGASISADPSLPVAAAAAATAAEEEFREAGMIRSATASACCFSFYQGGVGTIGRL